MLYVFITLDYSFNKGNNLNETKKKIIRKVMYNLIVIIELY